MTARRCWRRWRRAISSRSATAICCRNSAPTGCRRTPPPNCSTVRSAAQLALGDVEAARASASAAERLAPDAAEPAVATAKVAIASKDLGLAMRELDRALSHDPKQPDALLLEGEIMLGQGNRTGAIAKFDADRRGRPRPRGRADHARRARCSNRGTMSAPSRTSTSCSHASRRTAGRCSWMPCC